MADSHEFGAAIATGNIWLYVTGTFFGTSTFGPVVYTSEGPSDMFVAILGVDGTWAAVDRTWGGGDCYSHDIKLNAQEDMYVTGQIIGTVEFASTTLHSSGFGNRDIFVAKLDRMGTWEWAVQAGAPGSTPDYAANLELDSAGNIFLAGGFYSEIQFGASTLISSGADDIYLAKLDPVGNWLWGVKAGGNSYDSCEAMARDSEGNLILTGLFRDTISFGSHSLVCSGVENSYIAKADSNGNWLWAKQLIGAQCVGITTDAFANIYVSGNFWQALTLGNYIHPHAGTDLFAAKLDSAGNWIWATAAGAYGNSPISMANAITLNPSGNPCVTGTTMGNTYFNALDGDESEMSFGDKDLFIAKLSEFTGADDPLASVPAGVSILRGVFPNPIRTGHPATLKACLGSGESGLLKVCNLRGQTVYQQELGPGEHLIELDSAGLSPGLYLCRLTTPSVSQTCKFILLR